MEQSQLPAENEAQANSIPWSASESWVGVLLLILLNVGLFLFVREGSGAQLAQSATIVFAELAYILPVVIILGWKHIPWKYLGFGKFSWSTMNIGCGMLFVGYGIIIVHNFILSMLGIDPQGKEIFDIFSSIDSPVWLFLAAVIVAPIVEEIFFRGFLFQGFRKRYGWVPALLLSSFIFAAAHLDLAALIPTFILGIILTYMYHHSNSLWPGMILHFLINATSTLSVYFITQYPHLIPS
jgi:membrane protease YdiL (CAAX protease family)